MQIQTFKGGYDGNFSYVVYDSGEAVIIDTALDPTELFSFIERNNLELKHVFVMHSHFDHTVQLEKYAGKLVGSAELPFHVDRKVVDGDELSVGGKVIKVIHAPGHTPDCILLLVDGNLFTTDVLFIDGCGRVDLPGGDVNVMSNTLEMIKQLPDDTTIYPGHDYGNTPTDTLGNQKKTNRFLKDFFTERNA